MAKWSGLESWRATMVEELAEKQGRHNGMGQTQGMTGIRDASPNSPTPRRPSAGQWIDRNSRTLQRINCLPDRNYVDPYLAAD